MKASPWLGAALVAVTVGCSATPPANWQKGGAPVEIPRARWVFGTSVVEIMQDGSVLANSEPVMTIDRGGRVYDPDREPIALLEPDGRVVGPDDEALGIVGAEHASKPEEENAWLSVARSGEVIIYNDEGERMAAGVWIGCNGSARAHQVCTLVTHLMALKMRALAERSEPSVGIGIGIGVGVGR